MLKGVLRKNWWKRDVPGKCHYSSKDNKVRTYSSSVVVLEFLFLCFLFAFALLLAKHTTEVTMAAPTRVPTKAPTMIPTSGSGGYKQLVSKVVHIVCLIHVHLWLVGTICSIHKGEKRLYMLGTWKNLLTLSFGLTVGEERCLDPLFNLPIHIYIHKVKNTPICGRWGLF